MDSTLNCHILAGVCRETAAKCVLFTKPIRPNSFPSVRSFDVTRVRAKNMPRRPVTTVPLLFSTLSCPRQAPRSKEIRIQTTVSIELVFISRSGFLCLGPGLEWDLKLNWPFPDRTRFFFYRSPRFAIKPEDVPDNARRFRKPTKTVWVARSRRNEVCLTEITARSTHLLIDNRASLWRPPVLVQLPRFLSSKVGQSVKRLGLLFRPAIQPLRVINKTTIVFVHFPCIPVIFIIINNLLHRPGQKRNIS